MKKKVKKINVLCILLLAVVFIVTIYSIHKNNVLIDRHDVEIEHLKSRLKQEYNREHELLKQKKYSKSDKYLEEMARDTLGLIKPNEIILKPNK